ncbi:phosphoribosyltransferase family protein [Bacillus sp. 2205SS5-2]|uniref:phosphoribosyltransferase family protein n=1 Tax=Bacillus sp. 2205SS5-2 TaxID=3109031 RepID=UPI003006E0D8
MKNIASSMSLQSPNKFPILGDLEVEVLVQKNPLELPIEALFKMAARINKKRAFLFVSRVLGKHLRVSPYDPLIISALLTLQYANKESEQNKKLVYALLSDSLAEKKAGYESFLTQKVKLFEDSIIIGFAETATALGHGVFDSVSNGYYIHTTREQMRDQVPVLTFEEEHSHAVDQLCFSNRGFFENEKPIILVDDEMTTGKTTLNIIRDLHTKFPRKKYVVLAILDWRSSEHQAQFRKLEEELAISIETVSLISGDFHCVGNALENGDSNLREDIPQLPAVDWLDLSSVFTASSYLPRNGSNAPFIKETGRFGLAFDEMPAIHLACKEAAKIIERKRMESNILCIGNGELMYLPMKIASFMEGNVYVQSSTRSPIHSERAEHYAINEKTHFMNPEDQATNHFLYNIKQDEFDEVILFFERKVEIENVQPLLNYLCQKGVKHVLIAQLSNEMREHNC